VQHLRPRGVHARAFTCREDNDVNVHAEESERRRAGSCPPVSGSIIARIAF
jgi:hypothetical protein